MFHYYEYEDRIIMSPIKLNLPESNKEAFEKSVKTKALKDELKKYDYIGVKIAMGVATVDEYASEIAYTESLRAQVRALEET